MMNSANTIRVVIPLTFRKKNGRPKILPPADHGPVEKRAQDAHVLRAIARAWNWRRQLVPLLRSRTSPRPRRSPTGS